MEFWQKKWHGFQNFFYVSRGTILDRFLEKTNYAFCSSFLVVEQKRWLLAWNFWQVCLNCSFCVHRNVFGVFLEGSLMVRAFSVSERNYPYFRKKTRQSCQKYTLRLQRNNYRTICGRKNLCSNFLVFEQKNRTFGLKLLPGLSKLQPTSPEERLKEFFCKFV